MCFFLWSGDPRILAVPPHSFPPRRSSVLLLPAFSSAGVRQAEGRAVPGRPALGRHGRGGSTREGADRGGGRPSGPAGPASCACRRTGGADRTVARTGARRLWRHGHAGEGIYSGGRDRKSVV